MSTERQQQYIDALAVERGFRDTMEAIELLAAEAVRIKAHPSSSLSTMRRVWNEGARGAFDLTVNQASRLISTLRQTNKKTGLDPVEKAVGDSVLAAILRQVDEMMFSIGRSYRGGRRWARMRTRDWLVLRPEWSVDPLEISVELGSALGVLLVKDAEELGSWLSVDYQSLASRMLDGAKPPWLLRALKENEGAETHDYSYADVVKRGPRGWGRGY